MLGGGGGANWSSGKVTVTVVLGEEEKLSLRADFMAETEREREESEGEKLLS